MSVALTIDDMLQSVPEGGSRLFPRQIADAVEDRFFSVRSNQDYPRQVDWRNVPPMEEMPWMGTRQKARTPISVLPPPEMTFDGAASQMVDLYAHGGLQVFFISDRLFELIEGLDPQSLDRRAMTITASDRAVDFNLVMPARNLDAIDVERTDVLVKDEKLATQWIRYVRFPAGVVFRQDALAGMHNFSDRSVPVWFWSRELIDAAKVAGIKGVRTMRAGMVTGAAVDRF